MYNVNIDNFEDIYNEYKLKRGYAYKAKHLNMLEKELNYGLDNYKVLISEYYNNTDLYVTIAFGFIAPEEMAIPEYYYICIDDEMYMTKISELWRKQIPDKKVTNNKNDTSNRKHHQFDFSDVRKLDISKENERCLRGTPKIKLYEFKKALEKNCNKTQGKYYIHRVLLSFHQKIDNTVEVHHINENNLDNNLSNLLAIPVNIHRELHNKITTEKRKKEIIEVYRLDFNKFKKLGKKEFSDKIKYLCCYRYYIENKQISEVVKSFNRCKERPSRSTVINWINKYNLFKFFYKANLGS